MGRSGHQVGPLVLEQELAALERLRIEQAPWTGHNHTHRARMSRVGLLKKLDQMGLRQRRAEQIASHSHFDGKMVYRGGCCSTADESAAPSRYDV
jgi:hypothetical protein